MLIHFVTEKPWRTQHPHWADYKLWNSTVRELRRRDPEHNKEVAGEGIDDFADSANSDANNNSNNNSNNDTSSESECAEKKTEVRLETEEDTAMKNTYFFRWFPLRIFYADPQRTVGREAIPALTAEETEPVISLPSPQRILTLADFLTQHGCEHISPAEFIRCTREDAQRMKEQKEEEKEEQEESAPVSAEQDEQNE